MENLLSVKLYLILDEIKSDTYWEHFKKIPVTNKYIWYSELK